MLKRSYGLLELSGSRVTILEKVELKGLTLLQSKVAFVL